MRKACAYITKHCETTLMLTITVQLTPGNSFTLESCLIVHLHRLGARLPFMGWGKGATSKHENQAIKRGAGPFSLQVARAGS